MYKLVRKFVKVRVDATRLKLIHAARYPLRSPQRLVNNLEMRVFGIHRSGNHAIINWVFLNHPGATICFLNNIREDRHHNPYLSFGQAFLKGDGGRFIHYEANNSSKVRLVRHWHLRHPQKDVLICSYENRDLAMLPDDALNREHDRCMGSSRCIRNLLILRDPFNTFASKFKQRQGAVKPVRSRLVEMWKVYAREFLGRFGYLAPGRVPINYNAWCADANYRRSLASRLGLVDADRGINQVPNIADGSSFDSTRFDGRAQAMRTSERWRHFEHVPEFRRIFADRELFELSEQIFGVLPGRESLVD